MFSNDQLILAYIRSRENLGSDDELILANIRRLEKVLSDDELSLANIGWRESRSLTTANISKH